MTKKEFKKKFGMTLQFARKLRPKTQFEAEVISRLVKIENMLKKWKMPLSKEELDIVRTHANLDIIDVKKAKMKKNPVLDLIKIKRRAK